MRRPTILLIEVCLFSALAMAGQVPKPAQYIPGGAIPGGVGPAEPDPLQVTRKVPVGPQAVVPRLMKFGGSLHDAAGKPLSGTVDVTFSLYSTDSGDDPLWFETQSVQADELGRYTALLGAMHSDGLPLDLFTSGEAHWLAVQVGNEPELQPRVLLVSVPYALKAGDAETLGGKPASAYLLADRSGTDTENSTSGSTTNALSDTSGKVQTSRKTSASPLTGCTAVTSSGAAVTNSIAYFPSPCIAEGAAMYQSSGKLGIGTSVPATTLDITSGSNAGMRIFGSGTHQLQMSGATSGRLGQDAQGFFFSSDTNGASIRFGTNNGTAHEWMRITSAGNVGIGTTSPQARLHVHDGSILLDRGNSYETVLDQSLGGVFTITNNTAVMAFNASGNLGIGTTTPVTALDVKGSINASNVIFGGQLISLASNGTPPLSVSSTTQVANLNASLLGGFSPSAFAPASGSGSYVAKSGDLMTGALHLPQNGLKVGQGFANEFAVTGGNVGIGTDTPGVLLDVNAPSANNASVRITSSGNDAAISLKNTNGSGQEYWIDSGGGSAAIGSGNFAVWDATNLASRLMINPQGTVGVNVGDPTAISTCSTHCQMVVNDTTAGSTGMYVGTTDTTQPTTAIFGIESSGKTGGIGVKGTSSGGHGVDGESTNGYGVYGSSGTVGVFGNGTGSGYGLDAESSSGLAAYFLVHTSPNILLAQTYSGGSVFRVSSAGGVYADGGYASSGADFAESVAVRGERSRYEPGDLLVIDERADRHLELASKPYSTLVAGIYSTKPGMLATPHEVANGDLQLEREVPLAVVGIVPCKVTAENGPIRRGDLLVTSSRPGYAMKGTNRSRMLGAVVGKAMEPLAKGKGVIQVLVTLQ